MRIEIHVHHHYDRDQGGDGDLSEVLKEVRKMGVELDDLEKEVSENTTVTGSAIALIRGFKAQLEAAGNNPAKLRELAQKLDSNEQALAAAVAEHTAAGGEQPPATT